MKLTWQASTPPDRTPAHIMREVIWPVISWLHTVSLMMRTCAFCSTVAPAPEINTHGNYKSKTGKEFKNIRIFDLGVKYERLCERCKHYCIVLLLTPFSSGTPASDSDNVAGGVDVRGRGQANGSNGVTEGHGWVQLHQSDVVVIGVGVVVRVRNDLF